MNKTNQKAENILDKSMGQLLDGLTGIAVSGKTENIITISKLLRGLRSGQFVKTLTDEWKRLQDQGKIATDFTFYESSYDSLSEIFEYLDNGIPNHKIFNVLKSVFLKSAIQNQKEDLLPLQYIKIAKSMTEGELIVLSTIYRLFKVNNLKNDTLNSASHYVEYIANESGLKHSALVEMHEGGLIEKKLITERTYTDKSGVELKPFFRLTNLGKSFCDYINEYDE